MVTSVTSVITSSIKDAKADEKTDTKTDVKTDVKPDDKKNNNTNNNVISASSEIMTRPLPLIVKHHPRPPSSQPQPQQPQPQQQQQQQPQQPQQSQPQHQQQHQPQPQQQQQPQSQQQQPASKSDAAMDPKIAEELAKKMESERRAKNILDGKQFLSDLSSAQKKNQHEALSIRHLKELHAFREFVDRPTSKLLLLTETKKDSSLEFLGEFTHLVPKNNEISEFEFAVLTDSDVSIFRKEFMQSLELSMLKYVPAILLLTNSKCVFLTQMVDHQPFDLKEVQRRMREILFAKTQTSLSTLTDINSLPLSSTNNNTTHLKAAAAANDHGAKQSPVLPLPLPLPTSTPALPASKEPLPRVNETKNVRFQHQQSRFMGQPQHAKQAKQMQQLQQQKNGRGPNFQDTKTNGGTAAAAAAAHGKDGIAGRGRRFQGGRGGRGRGGQPQPPNKRGKQQSSCILS